MAKLSKQLLYFERICKEIDIFKIKIDECNSEEQNKVRILKTKVSSYENILSQAFEKLSPKENNENLDTYLKYQEIVCDLLINLEEKTKVVSQGEIRRETQSQQTSFVRLPKFDLQNFYGDSEQWISFKEIFKSTILGNDNLSKIQKLQYLHSAVRGNAAKLIRGFSLKEENLEQCWDLLCERFENKRQLALSQINKIFSVKIIKANNSKSLLELLDTCNESVRNLQTLGLESNSLSDLMLINFMLTKLDQPLRQRWELMLENDKIPDLDSFRKFIEREARSIEESKYNKVESKFNFVKRSPDTSRVKTNLVNSAIVKMGNNCVVCSQSHSLFKCPVFNTKPVKERWKIVEVNKLCQNCLRSNHQLENCRISINCKNCSLKHHTLLHVYATGSSNSNPEISVSNSAQCQTSVQNYNVLLSTALVNIVSSTGNVIQCRALIDNASQNSLISNQIVERLKLPLFSTTHKLVGINGISAETCIHSTEFKLSPYFAQNYFCIKALVVNQVTTPLPNFRLRRHNWPHTTELQLADPNFHVSSQIDLLLGADHFASMLLGSPIAGQSGEPIAIPTKLGYLLSGPVTNKSHLTTSVTCHAVDLTDFFNLESVPNVPETITSDPAELIYKGTTRRNLEGRYVLKLPLKENANLGDSASQALKTFYSLEARFARDPELKLKYTAFIEEYIQLGHMKLANLEDLNIKPQFYLPHHSVINNNSSTTKLRVVFNASAKSSNGQSLNSVLLKGPKLQSSIFSNLIKFRLHQVALAADIEKMYRQILVSEEDTQLQRIFWRKNPSDPLLVYLLKTVTYGTSCAPFLALRTIQQLLEDEKANFPIACHAARDHMYVDDFLGGSNSIESAQFLVNDLQNLFHSGGFQLRKWASNESPAIEALPEALKSSHSNHSFNPDSSQRILGLEWNLENDSLRVQVVEEKPVTSKRQLLSIVARIFDPLGLLSPSIIILKILLQDVWKANLNWDDDLPVNILEKWNKFHSEMVVFKSMHIPRYMNISSSERFEIHGFCDASTQAYAAVVYLKTLSNPVTITLVASKTRVAPATAVTLPRLELCSALLLSELINVIKNSLPDSTYETFLWTDSTIALSWILNPPAKGNQFVLHRANKIRQLTPTELWHHIPGKHNPADCATRGLYPYQLKDCQSWWSGPKWLTESSYPFLKSTSNIPVNCLTIETSCFVNQVDNDFHLLTKFSSYSKLIRVVAWIQRFTNNTRVSLKVKDPLNTNELENACKTVVRLLQNSSFPTEINLLKQHKPLPRASKLLSLNAFLDSDDILRVGGRLRKHKTLPFNFKHPMLIPKNHPLTEAIIRYFHLYSLHAGPEQVLSLIRNKFWIPDGRSAVKRELRKCLRCIRTSAQPLTQIMGDLPSSRVNPCRVFQQVGIDFAGPINTKCQHTRKYATFKSYICLFICMCTKAVHIELVSDLTTEAFLQTLRRFISRRGCPSDIFSDNGKTFVGAASCLKKLFQMLKESRIQDFSSQRQILWHFIPPYAPNFGGLWESSIKLAKRHLTKSCQGTLLNFEELSTTLCLIEACINSRPLTPLSTDPNDVTALTPGHFLIGAPLLALPELSNNNNTSLSILSRWKLCNKIRDQFWQRWSKDYLQSLTLRPKWKRGNYILKPGQIVLVKDSPIHPTQWKLAVIEEVYPGADGIVRVVTLRSKDGTFKRPIQQLATLPEIDVAPPEVMETRFQPDSGEPT